MDPHPPTNNMNPNCSGYCCNQLINQSTVRMAQVQLNDFTQQQHSTVDSAAIVNAPFEQYSQQLSLPNNNHLYMQAPIESQYGMYPIQSEHSAPYDSQTPCSSQSHYMTQMKSVQSAAPFGPMMQSWPNGSINQSPDLVMQNNSENYMYSRVDEFSPQTMSSNSDVVEYSDEIIDQAQMFDRNHIDLLPTLKTRETELLRISDIQNPDSYTHQYNQSMHDTQNKKVEANSIIIPQQHERVLTSSTPNRVASGGVSDENQQSRINLSRKSSDRDQQQSEETNTNEQDQFIDMGSYGGLSQDWLDTICRHLIEHMNRFGICVIDNFLGPLKGESILKEVQRLYNNGQYIKGRLVSNKLNSSTSGPDPGAIRNDRVIWIDGCESGCSEINNLIQTLCSVITNSSRLALYSNEGLDKIVINKRTKAHVACYPGNGTRYVKHVDNPNDDGRVITSIYYINKDWNTKREGGLLRMFPVGMDEVANIEPLFDRALFFWSDRRNPHEVLPAYKDRFAITVWFIGESR